MAESSPKSRNLHLKFPEFFGVFAVIKMELSGKSVYGTVSKTTLLSAHAQNHASPERCRKSFTMIFLGDHDNRFKFWQSDSI